MRRASGLARRTFRAGRRFARAHPFLLAFLALAIWTTVGNSAGYFANEHRINDIEKLRRLVAVDRGKLVADSDYKLCIGQNQIRRQIRGVVLDDARTKQTLGVGPKAKLTEKIVRREAHQVGPVGDYARLVVKFLDRFADQHCKKLPSQKLPKVTS